MNGMVKQDKDVPKSKDEIAEKTMGFFNGDKKLRKEDYKTAKDIKGFTGMMEGCCVCIPMHINKVKSKNVEKFNKSKVMFEKLY